MRHFPYVGASHLLETAQAPSIRVQVRAAYDVLQWIATYQPHYEADDNIITTFIVALNGTLWIADQRSEHVRCARGQSVLSAGEMTFAVSGDTVVVVAVTNQSTGYCPDPSSWPAVDHALLAAHIPHPPDFTTAYIFRICPACHTINIIKDEWYYCGVCDAELDNA